MKFKEALPLLKNGNRFTVPMLDENSFIILSKNDQRRVFKVGRIINFPLTGRTRVFYDHIHLYFQHRKIDKWELFSHSFFDSGETK